MKESTHERWSAHGTAWSSSGRTCKEYAAKAGINPRTLMWWKSKLRDAAGAATVDMPKFVDTRIFVRGRVDTEAPRSRARSRR